MKFIKEDISGVRTKDNDTFFGYHANRFHKTAEHTQVYAGKGLSALDVDRINRNTKPLDKEEKEIHKRLMPKQKTKVISLSSGNIIDLFK